MITTGGSFTALFDANALFSPLVVDLSLSLATADIFRAKWSMQIHDEWVRAVLRRKPDIPEAQLRRRLAAMDQAFPDALVPINDIQIQAFISLLPDPDDAHVLAAAVVGRANVLVTDNLKDFPTQLLASFGIQAQSVDDFLNCALDIDVTASRYAVNAMISRRKRPQPWSSERVPLEFEQRGLIQTAERLRSIIG